jgi:hypothetical protein
MFLISRLLQAAQSWRRRRGGPKTAKGHAIAVEQLDHRQLLSVNFTGNVAIDFPATSQPGVVLFNSSNTVAPITEPVIPKNLAPFIPVSGFALSEIAVSYNQADDTLSIGIDQPDYPSTGTPVIPGDADGNGVAGTVNDTVIDALLPGQDFTEYPYLGGSDELGAALYLANPAPNGAAAPDVLAGFSGNLPPMNPSTNPTIPPKTYEVAAYDPDGSSSGRPTFSTSVVYTNNTGNFSLQNNASHPNFEFNITNFSQLYQEVTGHALTPQSVIGIGAFGSSLEDGGISDAYFPENTFTLAQATPVVPPANPEPSPPILINPHEHRIIDTHHRDLIRVSVFGTSGFPVSEINPDTVELNGAHAIARIDRKVHRDEFPFQTYVFVANQLTLPTGLTTATLTGTTYSGVNFTTQKKVLNIPDSAKVFGKLKHYMGDASIYKALAKIEAKNPSVVITNTGATADAVTFNHKPTGNAAIKVSYTPEISAAKKASDNIEKAKARPVVSIKTAADSTTTSNISSKLRNSLNAYLK